MPVADLLAGQPASLPPDRTAGSAMHYTSGTTGRPKGVRRELAGIDPDDAAELTTLLLQIFGVPPGQPHVHLVTSPNYHTAVTLFGGAAIHLGHTLVYMDSWDSETALEHVQRYRVTSTHMVPTQFKRMLSLPDSARGGYDLSSMRWIIHAAAPCPVPLKRAMLDWWGPRVFEYYAATEGGGTLATPQDWLDRPGTVGRPWPTSEIMIADDHGNACPPGMPGTVYMKMSTTTFEYKGDPAKTEANRLGGFFTAGDIGYLDEDGFLFLCDRKADMIISGGVNIYPAEVEAELIMHPGGGRRCRVRGAGRGVGRAGDGRDRARARAGPGPRPGRGHSRVAGREAGPAEVAVGDRLHRPDAPRPQRQAAQAPPARTLLAGPGPLDLAGRVLARVRPGPWDARRPRPR